MHAHTLSRSQQCAALAKSKLHSTAMKTKTKLTLKDRQKAGLIGLYGIRVNERSDGIVESKEY
ncbi:UNVERIFIED_CONTAM: hypothetical protein FKN15_040457 [Acipenser sinensis]